ncbi:MAG: orotidine-5'-phosphate decarboxylase [bacterium]
MQCTMPEHFADTLIARVRELGHPLCAGIDPHLPMIPPLFRRASMAAADPATADAVEAFVLAGLERIAPYVAVVKPQSAFFELLGWRGVQALEQVVEQARLAGCQVILDAKRGDIGTTAAAYAGCLDDSAPMQVDALTISPYLGRDTLAPFFAAVGAHGRGVFVLAKTSNPGSADLQDRLIDGVPLYAHVAAGLADAATQLRGPVTGWSSLGIVAGATHPAEHERLRAALPDALFLVPGYGAQGACAADAVRAFVAGPRGREGGIVSSSRALLFPPDANTDDLHTWERAIDAAVQRAVDELGSAVAA